MTTTAPAAKGKAVNAATKALHRSYLRQMLLIRRFEEKTGEAYALGKIGGFCHLYIGQEAVAVGVMAALRPDDHVVSAYREHGHALARGLTPRGVMAELYGKATGVSAGKGGSMHLFDVAHGFLGGHGIVGSHIPLAAGVAFAHKYRGGDQVCVCFFGEAAANIGAFHETLNMAALWNLPAIFIVENNGYGMGTAVARAAAVTSLAIRGAAYAMTTEVVDGQDVLAMREAMDRAVARARMGSEPTFLEVKTYRYVGHSMSDAAHGTYRTKEEVDEYRGRDPLTLLGQLMRTGGYWTDADHAALEAEIEAEVADSIRFAEESPDPEPSKLFEDVYAPEPN